jgi:hypothetical protein
MTNDWGSAPHTAGMWSGGIHIQNPDSGSSSFGIDPTAMAIRACRI